MKPKILSLCVLLVAGCCAALSGCDSQQQYHQHPNQPGWNVDVDGAGWNVDINGQLPQRNPHYPNVRPRPAPLPRQPLIQPRIQPQRQPALCPGPRCPAPRRPQCQSGSCPATQHAIDTEPETVGNRDSIAVKQGSCKCLRCMRHTVGADWHSLWTPDGDVATYLCQDCWDRTTPAEHDGYLRLILQRAKLPSEKREPFVAALKSAIASPTK